MKPFQLVSTFLGTFAYLFLTVKHVRVFIRLGSFGLTINLPNGCLRANYAIH
jgi:hypothetical protein